MRLVLGARSKTQSAIDTRPLDLSRLASVREFAQGVIQELGDSLIDGLVLNAGTQFPNIDQRTEDGFETTFAVNHLAHYLLLQLLLPKLAQGATVVITTSDTHDPKANPMGPKELDPEPLAHPPARHRPTGFSAGFRAYAASKLCDLLMARGLAASGEAKVKRFTVVAYNPGLTIGYRRSDPSDHASRYRGPGWSKPGRPGTRADNATRRTSVCIACQQKADVARSIGACAPG